MSEPVTDRVSDDYVVTWGKYIGSKVGNLPCSYLLWAMAKDWCQIKYPQFYRYCIQNEDLLLEEYEKQYGRSWSQNEE